MSKIGTNQMAVNAQKAMSQIQRKMTKTMEKLSTGFRINKSGDDAAGLAVSTKMTAQIRGTNQAARNISDAIALVQTADGATKEISAIMQRMRELAVQGATETYSTNDLQLMDTEYQQLEAEITRIVDQTKWNKMSLFDGNGPNAATSSSAAFQIQVGSDNGQAMTVTIGNLTIDAGSLGDLSLAGVSTQTSASAAITAIDNAFTQLATIRADYGSFMNRLGHSLNNAEVFSANMSDANSRLLDTDYAKEMTEFAKSQIVRQAGMAMLSQANAIPNQVLQLLQ